jgi:hypothetical protein
MTDEPHVITEAEMFALVRVGDSIMSNCLTPDQRRRCVRGEPGEGDISPGVTKQIEGRRRWNARVEVETKRVKALLLQGGDDDAVTSAAEVLWNMHEDRGRADLLEWAWWDRRRIGRRPWSRLLANSWLRPKLGSLVTNWGCWGQRTVARMFDHAVTEHLMEPDDLATFRALPSRITAWRGCNGRRPGRVRYGMSWTLDPDKARWFADRGEHLDLGYPVVLEATVLKEDVFAYYNERNERELVVRPGRVRAVKDVTKTEKPAS